MSEFSYIHACNHPFAVLDRELRLVAHNEAWNRVSAANPFPGWHCRVGESYAAACEGPGGVESEHVSRITRSLCQARDGGIAHCAMHYPLRTASGLRTFTVRIVRTVDEHLYVTHAAAEDSAEPEAAQMLARPGRVEELEDVIERATKELMRLNAAPGIRSAGPQESLERIRALLSGLLEQSTVATVIFAPDGTALWANEACRHLFAIHPTAPLATHNLFDDPVLSQHADEMQRCFVEGLRVELNVDYPLARLPIHCTSPQRVLRLRSTMFPVCDHAGRVFCAIVQHEDMTVRLAAEEQVQQQQAVLAHTLRVATITELASVLAHEVNQPLSAISNYARGCIHRLAPDCPGAAEILQALKRVAGEAERASAILRQVRTFMRKEGPRRLSEDVNMVIRDVAQIIDVEASRHGISVSYELAGRLPETVADRTQIQQVVLNLALNAIQAMAGCDERRLLIRTDGRDDGVQVSVSDSGPGLGPEVEARLFEPFFTTRPDGLGMGLAISRSIIESHGGKLWSERRTDHGATFLFSLPRPGEPAHAAR